MTPGHLFHSVEWNQYLEDEIWELCKMLELKLLRKIYYTSFSSELYNTDNLSKTGAIDGSH